MKIRNTKGDSHLISQVCSALFSKELDTISAILYDSGIDDYRKSTSDYLLLSHLTEIISGVFRNHGAVPIDDRSIIFPSPAIYEYGNLAKLMDRSGNILQLPYDLTYPFARKLAQAPINASKVTILVQFTENATRTQIKAWSQGNVMKLVLTLLLIIQLIPFLMKLR